MLDQATVIPCSIGSHDDTTESSGRAKISRSTESFSEGEPKGFKHSKARLLFLLPLEKAVHEVRRMTRKDLNRERCYAVIKQDVVLLTKTLSWQGRRSPPCTPQPGSHRVKRAALERGYHVLNNSERRREPP